MRPGLNTLIFYLCFSCLYMTHLSLQAAQSIKEETDMTPPYLYKIISIEDWKASKSLKSIRLSQADHDFIHLSREDQLDRILTKYWKDQPGFIVLKLDTSKLPGKLVLEANPGGTNKYYHLYNGSIPLEAIVEVETQKIQ